MESINIYWKKQNTTQYADRWFEVERPLEPRHQELSKAIELPSDCIDYLEQAFQKNLNRTTGWEVSDPSAGLAGSIYKRGVPLRSTTNAFKPNTDTVEGCYPVEVFSEQSVIEKILKSENTLFFIDQNVYDAWQKLLSKIKSKIIVTVSEKNKSLEFIAELFRNPQVTDNDQWIAIGGGVLTDCVAFAASLKNKKVTLVPTTLLAMVDASVGGKTGVNFPPYGKNQIGSFYFPEKVMVWSGWLSTLDQRNLRGGSNECIKHAVLKGDDQLLKKLNTDWITNDFEGLVKELINIKAEIVNQDPTEKGVRATLNFGHTLAHALESTSQAHSDDYLLHGEAVGLGIIFACMLSEEILQYPKEQTAKISSLMKKSHTLLKAKELSTYLGKKLDDTATSIDLWKLTLHDKKMTSYENGESAWVLLDEQGIPHKTAKNSYVAPVTYQQFDKTWRRFIEALD